MSSVTGWVLQEAETELGLRVQRLIMKGKEETLDWAGGAIGLQWRPDKALPAGESPLQKSHVGHKCLCSVLDGGYPEKSMTLAGKLK